MAKEGSFGICESCGVRKGKVAMVRHLKECLVAGANKGKLAPAMLLRVSDGPGSAFWLDVAVPFDAKLEQLDDLLRKVWLECCGHMSGFFEGRYDEISMNRHMTEVFGSVGDTVGYQYDFGSTTELTIRLAGITHASSGKPAVAARNEAPVWPCEECGRAAASICSECAWQGGGFCCAEHAPDHGCGDEVLLPVVNSPRMGVCGYTG
jgi:hypothetical protein